MEAIASRKLRFWARVIRYRRRRRCGIHEADGFAGAVEGLVEAGGEEAGFEAGAAEDGVLGKGDAFEGEELLGVDGW